MCEDFLTNGRESQVLYCMPKHWVPILNKDKQIILGLSLKVYKMQCGLLVCNDLFTVYRTGFKVLGRSLVSKFLIRSWIRVIKRVSVVDSAYPRNLHIEKRGIPSRGRKLKILQPDWVGLHLIDVNFHVWRHHLINIHIHTVYPKL